MAKSIRKDPQTCIVKRHFILAAICLALVGMVVICITCLAVFGFLCTSCTDVERKSAKTSNFCCHVLYEATDATWEEPTTKATVKSKIIKLCLHKNKVVKCDKENSTDHACLGYRGPRKCTNLEDYANNLMCADISYRHIFLCSKFSYNNRLCYFEGNQSTPIGLCGKSSELICFSESGYLELCANLTQQISTLNPSPFSVIDKQYKVKSILKGQQYPVEGEADSLSTFQDLITVTNHDDSSTLSTTQVAMISSTPKNAPTMLSSPQDRSSTLVNSTSNMHAFENSSVLSYVYGEETPVDQKVNLRNETGYVKVINGKKMEFNDIGSPATFELPDWVLFKTRSKMVIEGNFKPLCTKIGKTTGDLSECTDKTTNKTACIGILSGKIFTCKEYKETDIYIPVCIEESTRKVVTCEGSQKFNLCFLDGYDTALFKRCSNKGRQVCMDGQGSLKPCLESRIKDATTAIMAPEENIEDPLQELCRAKNFPDILFQCSETNGLKACMNIESGRIEDCVKLSDSKLIVRICMERASKELYTCEKFTRANVCILEDKVFLGTCKSKSNFACLNSGHIETCSSENSTVKVSAVQSTYYSTDKYSGEYNRSRKEQNTKKVYEAENAIISSRMKGVTLLCKNDVQKILSCEEDSGLQFLCLGIREGRIEDCEEFPTDSYVMPVCMETKTRNFMLCGKFYKGYLCIQKTITGGYLKTCLTSNDQACVTENGVLSKCVDMGSDNLLFQTSGVIKNMEREELSEHEGNNEDETEERKDNETEERKDDETEEHKDDEIVESDETARVEDHEEDINAITIENAVMQNDDGNNDEDVRGYDNENEQAGNDDEIIEDDEQEDENNEDQQSEKDDENTEDDEDEQSENGEDEQSENGEDEQSENDEDEQSENDEDEHSKNDEDEQSENDDENMDNGEEQIDESMEDENQSNNEDQDVEENSTDNYVAINYKERLIGYESTTSGESNDEYNSSKNDEDTEPREAFATGDEDEETLTTFQFEVIESADTKYLERFSKMSKVHESTKKYYDDSKTGVVKRDTNHDDGVYTAVESKDIILITNTTLIRRKLVSHFHTHSKLLCNHDQGKDEGVVDCDNVQNIRFACISPTSGQIQKCDLFDKSEPALPVCLQVRTNLLVTCDIFSNIRLCFGENGELPIQPCSGSLNFVCLTQDGKPTACKKDDNQRNHSVRRDASQQKSDE